MEKNRTEKHTRKLFHLALESGMERSGIRNLQCCQLYRNYIINEWKQAYMRKKDIFITEILFEIYLIEVIRIKNTLLQIP